jgi:hypothetical protein
VKACLTMHKAARDLGLCRVVDDTSFPLESTGIDWERFIFEEERIR